MKIAVQASAKSIIRNFFTPSRLPGSRPALLRKHFCSDGPAPDGRGAGGRAGPVARESSWRR
jgi:hypothetical protein